MQGARVSVEAGIAQGWREIVGDHGRIVSLEHYGASADYERIYREFGITAEAVAPAAEDSIATRAERPAEPPHSHATGTREEAHVRTTSGTSPDAGVSIWLDDLSRERIETGNLAELVKNDFVVGVTTNPTIFAAALSDGERYDDQVRELAAAGADVDETIFALTTDRRTQRL